MSALRETAEEIVGEAADRLVDAPRRMVPEFWRHRAGYDRSSFRADLVAGLTVALVSLPQAIGFSLIAGLPPQMVVTAVMVSGVAAAWFCSSRHAVIGPTNTTAVFIATTAAGAAAVGFTTLQVAVFLALTVGAIQFAAGLARIGNLTQFISRSVILGYSTGAAILIGAGQLPNVLGIEGVRGPTIFHTLASTAERLATLRIDPVSLALGGASLALLVTLRQVRPHWPEGILVLAAGTAATAAFGLHDRGVGTVADLGGLTGSIPIFTGLPDNWAGALPSLVNSAFALAVIGMLEAVSIAKNIAVRTGQRIDPNQELLGLGAGNLAASLFGAMPGSGSFVRSAVNHQAGGRTQLSAIAASLGLGAVLMLLSPVAGSIPVPVVAAILLLVAVQMVNLENIRTVVRATRADAVVFATTLAGTLLLNLDTAIYVGIGVSLALFLQKAASPSLVEYTFNDAGQLSAVAHPGARRDPQISIVHVEGDLFFGAADLLQDELRRLAVDSQIRVFILRMKNARHLDGSTVLALQQLSDHLSQGGRHLLVSGIHGDVARVFRRSGLIDRLGRENVFAAEENPTLATKKALQRAQQLIGGSAAVRLFYPQTEAAAPTK